MTESAAAYQIDENVKLTPMMEQYRSIKKNLPPGTILFFRLGDFYEMFFEDAVKASEILDITLTGREGGEAGRVPMCGIPYHSFQGYVAVLIENNLKVAICEQMGDPKAAKGLVERKITRIISPATYLDEEGKSKRPEYMAALSVNAKQVAIAYLDLGTGDFFVREVALERLASELSLIQPRELIVSKTFEEKSPFAPFIRENLNAAVTVYDDWIFEADEGKRLITENFGLASQGSVPFAAHELALSSAGVILYYLRDHLHSAVGHIRFPALLDTREFMVLDRQTQKSLELVSSLSGRKDSSNLFSVIDQTLTSMGSRVLYQWVTAPLLTRSAILYRQEGTAEFAASYEKTQTVRNLFKGIKDVERTMSRLNYGVANARDLVNLKNFLERVPSIQLALSGYGSAILKDSLKNIKTFPAIHDLILNAITDEPPLGLKDGGIIRDGYSKELDDLRSISRDGRSWILNFEKKEIERTGIKSLKVKYSQVFGYTIDISKANQHLVPPDYIRKQTLANSERFILPELQTWDEKITGAQDKIKALEYQIFTEVRAKILESLEPLQDMAKAIGQLDALSALAISAIQKKWTRPDIMESSELLIDGGRHPVVETMLPSGQFVENDTCLNGTDKQLIVLTGPNMAGKSTYIRQIALIVLLAQMGSFVPAARAKIGLTDRIFTRIGASDDLARGESTFMVEMVEMAHILRSATSKSLLILDEVGRGTATFDGVSIAWAICEYLIQGKHKPRTLFATHYHELTQLEEHFPGVKNYNITVKETKQGITFLRKVARGGSDRSYGIHVARLAGIPEDVSRRAEKILAVLESESVEASEIIEGKPQKKSGKATLVPSSQLSFFDAQAKEHPLLDEIRKLAVDHLSPVEALNQIAAWKKELEKNGD